MDLSEFRSFLGGEILRPSFFLISTVFVFVSGFLQPSFSQSPEMDREIRKRMRDAAYRNSAECTVWKREIRRFKRRGEFEPYEFAFAGRKDSTITGIRGCGYGWSLSLERAQEIAMQNCRKWELKYGIGNGDKTCRIID